MDCSLPCTRPPKLKLLQVVSKLEGASLGQGSWVRQDMVELVQQEVVGSSQQPRVQRNPHRNGVGHHDRIEPLQTLLSLQNIMLDHQLLRITITSSHYS